MNAAVVEAERRAPEVATPHSAATGPRRALPVLLSAFASVQVVWFYLCHMHGYIKLPQYEKGLERTPFQYRLLLMEPLRWAHASPALNRWAARLSSQPSWFPTGVTAEGLVEAVVDLLSVVAAGLVARDLYRRASATRLLSGYVYPLTLLMVLATYALLNIHMYRFVYDLPSLGLFALGTWLIYVRAHPLWLVLVFAVGTVNRETTLFLLPLFSLAEGARGGRFAWRRMLSARVLAVTVPLLCAWAGWHVWVAHHFHANPSAAGWRLGLNFALLIMPLAWPQLLGVFGFVLPLVLAHARSLPCPVLRAWLWVLPAWFCFMLYYGVFVEIRIFGELIPLVAAAAALIAEQKLLARLAEQQSLPVA